MERNEILQSLIDAQVAHQKWIVAGEAILNNKDFSSVQKPLDCTKCMFGMWFYGNREFIKNIPGFRQIEELHKVFHEQYEILYNRAPETHKAKGIFGSHTRKKQQKSQLTEDFKNLKNTSILLTSRLKQVENIVSAMSDRLFERNLKRNVA